MSTLIKAVMLIQSCDENGEVLNTLEVVPLTEEPRANINIGDKIRIFEVQGVVRDIVHVMDGRMCIESVGSNPMMYAPCVTEYYIRYTPNVT